MLLPAINTTPDENLIKMETQPPHNVSEDEYKSFLKVSEIRRASGFSELPRFVADFSQREMQLEIEKNRASGKISVWC